MGPSHPAEVWVLWRAHFAVDLYTLIAHRAPAVLSLFAAVANTPISKLQVLAKAFFSTHHIGLFTAILVAFNAPLHGAIGGVSVRDATHAMRDAHVSAMATRIREGADVASVAPPATAADHAGGDAMPPAMRARRAEAYIIFACLVAAGRIRRAAADALSFDGDWTDTPCALGTLTAVCIAGTGRCGDSAFVALMDRMAPADPCAAAAASPASQPPLARAGGRLESAGPLRLLATAVEEGMRRAPPGETARRQLAAVALEQRREMEEDQENLKRMRLRYRVDYLLLRVSTLNMTNMRLSQALAASYVPVERASLAVGTCMLSSTLCLIRAEVITAQADPSLRPMWLAIVTNEADARRSAATRSLMLPDEAMLPHFRALVMATLSSLARSAESHSAADAGAALEAQRLDLTMRRVQWDEQDAADVLPILANLFAVRIHWTQPHATHPTLIDPNHTPDTLAQLPTILIALTPARWGASQTRGRNQDDADADSDHRDTRKRARHDDI